MTATPSCPCTLRLSGLAMSMLHRCPRSLRFSPSRMTRLLTPWATPVSITASGLRWATVHQIIVHMSMSASLYQP